MARAAQRYARGTCLIGKTPPALLSLPTAADVFEAVMSNKASKGVVVLEQGDSGILSGVRSLLKDNSLRVVGELTHETRFKLVSCQLAPGCSQGGRPLRRTADEPRVAALHLDRPLRRRGGGRVRAG